MPSPFDKKVHRMFDYGTRELLLQCKLKRRDPSYCLYNRLAQKLYEKLFWETVSESFRRMTCS